MQVQEVSRDVERNWKRGNDGDSMRTNGRQCRMTAATSDARRNSKQVETNSLTGNQSGQHGKRNHTMADVPEASKSHTHHPWSPTEHVNPLRC
ncbi:hypothetical protein EV363DRAFT_1164808 [Boletus edulis]|nr:hypothetical protein EV363DRAFT_1164808 [Boletus edulis]